MRAGGDGGIVALGHGEEGDAQLERARQVGEDGKGPGSRRTPEPGRS